MYLRNFGEFYLDQISHAKTVILSRTDVAKADKVEEALEIIRNANDHALIVTTPVAELSEEKLIEAYEASDDDFEAKLLEEVKAMKTHHHHHHHHHDEDECDDPHCECHHHHHEGELDADDVFTSYGFETAKVFNKEQLEASLKELSESEAYGQVLRAKGIVKGESSWYEFDLVPGQYEIRPTSPIATGKLCVIGANLSKKEIKALLLK
jgi:G3E family GTPase